MATGTTITSLESKTPTGDMYVVVEDSGSTGKTTLDEAVGVTKSVSGAVANIGDVDDLTTTAKDNLVSAINEVDGEIGNLASLTTTAKNNLVAALNELDGDIATLNSNSTMVVTSTNQTTGLTVQLSYAKSSPRIMRVKITGSTSAQLATASGYVNLWNANSFLSAAVGTRSATNIKYFMIGSYMMQLFVETGGIIKIGYATNYTDHTAVNIPAGTSFFAEELIFLS